MINIKDGKQKYIFVLQSKRRKDVRQHFVRTLYLNSCDEYSAELFSSGCVSKLENQHTAMYVQDLRIPWF